MALTGKEKSEQKICSAEASRFWKTNEEMRQIIEDATFIMRPVRYSSLDSNFTNSHIQPCRFTNFIVKSAVRTTRSSCVPAIGKVRPAPSADRKNCRKNFPPLRPPSADRKVRRHVRECPARADDAELVFRIRIETMMNEKHATRISTWKHLTLTAIH